MKVPNLQLPQELELSLLTVPLGFIIPFSLFFFHVAFDDFSLSLSVLFKAFPNVSELPSNQGMLAVSALIFTWSSLATLGVVLFVFAARRAISLLSQALTGFETVEIAEFLGKVLMLTLLGAIFFLSLSISSYGFFSSLL